MEEKIKWFLRVFEHDKKEKNKVRERERENKELLIK